jgi:hypothetical protein
MKSGTLVGIILIVIGVISLAYHTAAIRATMKNAIAQRNIDPPIGYTRRSHFLQCSEGCCW